MTYSQDLKPKGAGGVLYSSADFKNIQAEIDTLKSAVAVLQNKLADMADLVETGTLKATDAVQTDQLSANLAVLGTAVVEGELAVSNGSGNDKDVIVNRNGVPEWGPPTDINAIDVLVCDTVARATTVDHSGSVNTTDAVTQADSVTHADSVDHADSVTTLDSATTVNHADTIVDADNVTGADTVASAAIVNSANTVDSASTVTGATTVDSAATVTGATTVDHADTVTDADVATNVTTATNISTAENVTTCDTVTNTTTVTNADTVTDADTVAHADIVQVADVIQQTGDVSIVGSLAVTGDITQGADTLDNTYIKLTERGTANGVATLDSTGRIPASQLTIDAMEYKGKWNASTNTPTLVDGTGTDGDFYIVSVAGTQDLGSGSIDFYVNDRVLYNGSAWERVPAGQVDSVNGATGDVVLTGEDIAESTSDNLKIDRRLKNWLFVDGQGANATKTARGYFSADGIALITFDANNVYQDAFSLTINGVTCQVYLNGAPTSSTNYTLPKGTYIVKIGILGLTPYYIIETSVCVFSARKALEIESSKLSSCGLLDLVYPVGSLYWSSKATSPNTLFGGTWTRIKDKFLWAMGDSDTANATGGEKTHTLITSEMPKHTHTFSGSTSSQSTPKDGKITYVSGITGTAGIFSNFVATSAPSTGSGTASNRGYIEIDIGHTHDVSGTNSEVGSGDAHNNMPPYICKYCWERTA